MSRPSEDWGRGGGNRVWMKNPDSDPPAGSFLLFLLNIFMNLLPQSVAAGGGLVSEGVERIYHCAAESAFAHRGVTVNMWNKVGVGFLRQITVIRFGSFPRSVTDRYAGESIPFGDRLKQRCIVWRPHVPAFHYVLQLLLAPSYFKYRQQQR